MPVRPPQDTDRPFGASRDCLFVDSSGSYQPNMDFLVPSDAE